MTVLIADAGRNPGPGSRRRLSTSRPAVRRGLPCLPQGGRSRFRISGGTSIESIFAPPEVERQSQPETEAWTERGAGVEFESPPAAQADVQAQSPMVSFTVAPLSSRPIRTIRPPVAIVVCQSPEAGSTILVRTPVAARPIAAGVERTVVLVVIAEMQCSTQLQPDSACHDYLRPAPIREGGSST